MEAQLSSLLRRVAGGVYGWAMTVVQDWPRWIGWHAWHACRTGQVA